MGKKEATDAALRKKLIKKHLEKMEKKEKKDAISATNAVLMSLGARNYKKAREIYDAAVERCGGTAPVTMMCAMVRATDAAHRPFAIQLARDLQLHGARPYAARHHADREPVAAAAPYGAAGAGQVLAIAAEGRRAW